MLDDTVSIVCGAGRGIGEATAKLMAEKGATVVVNDLGVDVTGGGSSEQPAQETVNDIEADGGTAMVHYGDVTDQEYTEQLLEDTIDEYGAVHSISNFAGILRDRMVFNMTEDEWDAVIDVHLKGHFNLMHGASRRWRERFKEEEYKKQRSFLCVSSGSAGGNPGQANYGAAKAGILGLTRVTARELHQYNVRVNALWPGAATRMTETVPEERSSSSGRSGRGPEQVAPLPTYLASEEAKDITGVTFGMSSGRLSYISDPTRDRTMIKDPVETGGWTPEEIAENMDQLTDGLETTKVN